MWGLSGPGDRPRPGTWESPWVSSTVYAHPQAGHETLSEVWDNSDARCALKNELGLRNRRNGSRFQAFDFGSTEGIAR